MYVYTSGHCLLPHTGIKTRTVCMFVCTYVCIYIRALFAFIYGDKDTDVCTHVCIYIRALFASIYGDKEGGLGATKASIWKMGDLGDDVVVTTLTVLYMHAYMCVYLRVYVCICTLQ